MSTPRYETPAPATAADVDRALTEDADASAVADLLVGAALNDPDWRAVQDLCLRLLTEPDSSEQPADSPAAEPGPRDRSPAAEAGQPDHGPAAELGPRDRGLAAVAATCLGHLARIHGTLDTDRVIPALMAARVDPLVRSHADDALDDIETFLDITVPARPA